jgi:methylenetetrahydrofolate reductase (NADPH)
MTPNKLTFSLELFPPQTPEGAEKLRAARARMARSSRGFFSVTFGAGGSTRDRTLETVLEIQREGTRRRRTCRASARRAKAFAASLNSTARNGIRHLVAHCAATCRRGWPGPALFATPTSWSNSSVPKPATGSTSRSPPTPSTTRRPRARSEDLLAFKRKLDAGANSAITQYFYNFDAYAHFIDECRAIGIDVTDRSRHHAHRQLQQPGALLRHLRRRDTALDQEEGSKATATIRHRSSAFGLDVVTHLCEQLLANGRPACISTPSTRTLLTSTLVAAPGSRLDRQRHKRARAAAAVRRERAALSACALPRDC